MHSAKNTILKSHGRPSWYGEDGVPLPAYVIGIAGGSASGKTHVAQQIVRSLGSIPSVVILSQDSFYKALTEEQNKIAFQNQYDFDHPRALDLDTFALCLADLKAGQQTNIPVYSFQKHQRLDETQYLYGATIIIAEGIMALHDPSVRALYDLKVFVQCDSDLMLARRIRRDVAERGRDVEGVLDQYLRFVKPSYDNFVLPCSRHADIIVPGSDNAVAIEIITTHIRKNLAARAVKLRQKMARPSVHLSSAGLSVPKSSARSEVATETEDDALRLNLTILAQTPQLRGIFTLLRDKKTHRGEFIFYADRLATLIVEKGMEALPYKDKYIGTPTGTQVLGKELATSLICGVTIIRSGGPLERGLLRAIRDVSIGSLLIQSDPKTGEPLPLHCMLPTLVRFRHLAENTWVFLLDTQVGTGAAALMAIRVLIDHGVEQERIIFLSFIVARQGGIHIIHKAFPKVRFVCGAVDDVLSEQWVTNSTRTDEHRWFDEEYAEEANAWMGAKDYLHRPNQPSIERRRVWTIEPGMGHIGDRYYL